MLLSMNKDGARLRHGNHPVVAEVSRTSGHSKSNHVVPCACSYVGEGAYEISFNVLTAGAFSVSARVFGEQVCNSPYAVEVTIGPAELLWGLHRGSILACSSTYENDRNYGPENLRAMDTSSSWMASNSAEEFVELGAESCLLSYCTFLDSIRH